MAFTDWFKKKDKGVTVEKIKSKSVDMGAMAAGSPSEAAGALARMMLPFSMGLGTRLSHGNQYMSWISIHDLVQALAHIIQQEELAGAVNLVAPHPVTNRQFTQALGQALHRPTFLPVPKFFISLFLGEMAKELLFASARVYPRKLEESGYVFLQPNLAMALQALLP